MDDEKQPLECDAHVIHVMNENLSPADFEQYIPEPAQLGRLTDVFKVFGDSTRLKIIFLLNSRELCVCDIAYILGMGQSAVSHQLRILRAADLVKTRREGKSIFYALDDDHVSRILITGLEHIREEHAHEDD
ncbi:MAG: ArsR/SmtB family transcription factor [Acetanaerobacterium sp.]